jgi:dienelactone hydrolase
MKALTAAVLLAATPALAKMTSKPVAYELGGVKFEGVLLFDDAVKTARPGLVLVPNWLGINPANLKQAEEVAGQKYVVFVADMYGKTGRPKNMEEAGKAAGGLKNDRKLMRARVNKALEVLLAEGKTAPLVAGKVGAVGFCFGGTTALELARSGAKIGAAVSIHGGLSSPTPADAKAIQGKVLALHGADDPNVPPEEVAAFEDEMRKAGVDWQLVAFGNAVHSFTDPDANMPGRAQYNAKVARRAYKMMDDFFAEAFGG